MKIQATLSIFVFSALLIAACASAPRPGELNQAAKLMQDQGAVDQASRAAPQVFQFAQRYYKMAEDAFEDGRAEDCLHYSLLAAIKFNTALEHGRRLAADERRAKAEQRLQVAQKTASRQTARRNDTESRIKRMEQILALRQKLEQEKEQSKAEKAKIASELEKAKAAAEAEQKAAAQRLAAEQALLEEAKQEKEIQELVATASSKIQTAEAIEAKEYDPGNLNSAKTYVDQAGKALAEKRYPNAKDLAKMADEKATAAISRAQEEYSKKKEKMKLLEERKSLFADANGIGTEVKQQQRGVVITLLDMFASGKNIILPERAYLIEKIGELAAKYPDYPLVIEGFTDSLGRDTDNLALSQSRAQSVLDYLVQVKKLEFNRVKASGYGSSNPVADNSKAEGRAKNRRVEVIFLFR